ncbi:hypothetical protein ACQP2E_27535 [Actinoplanes sp. CA-015351]|uniref:hypothetical protein n=1 Tax=Actinoplanes sp. CA-015351 TaxID=3239897 RepID=UPI003D9567C5
MIEDLRWRRLALFSVTTLLAAAGLSACQDSPAPATAVSSAPVPVAPSPDVTAPALPRPDPAAPQSEVQAWVGQEVRAAFKAQTEGLLTGDFDRFAGAAQPGDKAVLAELQGRFRTLRSLQVTRFEQRIDGQPYALPKKGTWRVVHIVDHCFVDRDCAADEAVFDSFWVETAAGLRLTGFRPHDRKALCSSCQSYWTHPMSRPWETTELVAQAGARTLLAVPVKYRNRLTELSRRAEKAAAIADHYGVGDGTVGRYLVFVADDASWKRWYTGRPGRWVAGQALPTGPARIEVEVLASELTSGFADELLTHELAHVSTLRGDSYYGRDDVWFLVEGMADYVQKQRPGVDGYRKRYALDTLLRKRPLRSVSIKPPADDASLLDADGRYAVGFYAVSFLFKKYGKAKTLQFFQGAVQYGIGLDGASQSAFGKPWATVDKESAAHIRAL